MKIVVLFAVLCLMGAGIAAGATDTVEEPKECKVCGMDRTIFARSRVLLTYADGTTDGFCSLHCAIEEIRHNKDRQIAAFKVGDYTSSALINAKTATWVIGGDKQGVMASVPTWAFAGENEARKFIAEHGGRLASFDEALESAGQEQDADHHHGGHDHHGHMGPGSQLIFNPAFGDDIYHAHPAGMWMTGYRYMRTNMSGLRAGTSRVPLGNAIPMNGTRYGYMMAPTRMSMDMHMLMLMYGLTDRLTVMGMTSYLENAMEMQMDMGMGMGSRSEPTMRTSGLGDSELRGIYKITDTLVGSFGLSLPTGNITQEFETMGMKFRAPYDMQLGSGTFDLKPALTYNALSDDAAWNWGGQVSYTYHPGNNDAGYSLGDVVKVTSWLQRALGPASTWLRFAYSNTGRIHGQDSEIQKQLLAAPSPDADPNNYGGQRLDGLVGVSYAKGPFSVGVEGGIPLYQKVNGLQLETDWFLTVGVQAMF